MAENFEEKVEKAKKYTREHLIASSSPTDMLMYEIKKQLLLKFPRFASDITESEIYYNSNLPVKTACTDGQDVYVDPEFFQQLSQEERLFLLAHEFMHKRYKHMFRLKDEETGDLKDNELWNWCGDAVINAQLKDEGFTMIKGGIDMPDAINYSADELYYMAKKNQIEIPMASKSQGGQGQKGDGEGSGQGQGQSSGSMQGDHSIWEDIYNESVNGSGNQNPKNEENKKQNNSQGQSQTQDKKSEDKNKKDDAQNKDKKDKDKDGKDKNGKDDEKNDGKKDKKDNAGNNQNKQGSNRQGPEGKKEDNLAPIEIDEKKEFAENKQLRIKNAKKAYEQMINKGLTDYSTRDVRAEGAETPIVDWRIILNRKLEREEMMYSQRRSIAENNWAYRMIDVEDEIERIVEVMLDTSGSISDSLLKGFLKQLHNIPALSDTKLFVGCFDHQTYGFKELKTPKDIENYKPVGGGGTNFDRACRAFSEDIPNKRIVNRIIFTDGDYGMMPGHDLKKLKVTWLVHENPEFSPCCGEVIVIDKKHVSTMHSMGSRFIYNENTNEI